MKTKNLTKTKFNPLEIKNLGWFLVARFLFILAAQMQFTLIIWETYKITNNVLYLGYISIVELIPAFLLAFYSGYIVDKYNRKSIFSISLILTLASSLVLSIAMLYNINNSTLTFLMMGVIFNSGIVRVFASSSQTALLGQIVPKEKYSEATTWHSGVWQVAIVLGPPFVGLLYKYIGMSFCQFLICIFFFISLLSLFKINKKDIVVIKTTKENFIQSIKIGWKFMWNCKELLGAFSLDMFAVLFGGATSLLPIFAKDVFKVGADGLGILRSATALGTIIVIFYLTIKPLKKHQGYILFGTIFCYGICMILLGLSSYFWLSFLILILSGIFDGINVIIRNTILQTKTPDSIKGKVASISTLFIMSSNEIGSLESSLTAKLMGLKNAVVFGGIATIFIVIIIYILIPKLKKLEY